MTEVSRMDGTVDEAATMKSTCHTARRGRVWKMPRNLPMRRHMTRRTLTPWPKQSAFRFSPPPPLEVTCSSALPWHRTPPPRRRRRNHLAGAEAQWGQSPTGETMTHRIAKTDGVGTELESSLGCICSMISSQTVGRSEGSDPGRRVDLRIFWGRRHGTAEPCKDSRAASPAHGLLAAQRLLLHPWGTT